MGLCKVSPRTTSYQGLPKQPRRGRHFPPLLRRVPDIAAVVMEKPDGPEEADNSNDDHATREDENEPEDEADTDSSLSETRAESIVALWGKVKTSLQSNVEMHGKPGRNTRASHVFYFPTTFGLDAVPTDFLLAGSRLVVLCPTLFAVKYMVGCPIRCPACLSTSVRLHGWMPRIRTISDTKCDTFIKTRQFVHRDCTHAISQGQNTQLFQLSTQK